MNWLLYFALDKQIVNKHFMQSIKGIVFLYVHMQVLKCDNYSSSFPAPLHFQFQ